MNQIAEKEERPKTVYGSIERMAELLSKSGISKDKGGSGDIKYKFRGIDDIRNNTSPLMKECALAILPNMTERVEKERHTKSGTLALWVTLLVDFKVVNTICGDSVSIQIYADSVDYSDKATQKAMSQAYKTLAINLFNIPTEGEQDTDAESIMMEAVNYSYFDSPELRKQYVQNCKEAFNKATTQKNLVDVYELYKDKITVMAGSKDYDDAEAGKELRDEFAKLYRELKEKTSEVKL